MRRQDDFDVSIFGNRESELANLRLYRPILDLEVIILTSLISLKPQGPIWALAVSCGTEIVKSLRTVQIKDFSQTKTKAPGLCRQ